METLRQQRRRILGSSTYRTSRFIARIFSKTKYTRWIARFIWRRQWDACDHCGVRKGPDQVCWSYGSTCWFCHDRLKK